MLVAANTVPSLAYYLRWLAACLTPAGPAPEHADEDEPREPSTPRPVGTVVAVACAAAAVSLGVLSGVLVGAA